jgi:hypothetical protein
MFGEVFGKVTPFTIFQEDVEVGLGFLEVDELDNPFTMALLQEVYLPLEIAQFMLYICLSYTSDVVLRDHLHCYLSVCGG